MLSKFCSHCKTEKPVEDFSKDKSRKDGLQRFCRKCQSETAKENRKKHSGRAVIVIPEFKLCRGCNTEKSGVLFNKSRSDKSGLCSHCKECTIKTQKSCDMKNLSREGFAPPNTKTCCRCSLEKPSYDFGENKKRKYGLDGWCKECVLFRHRQLKYGAPKEWIQDRLKVQDGRCAICGSPPSQRKALCVDHDHVNKKLRGLLCDSCNRAIGLLKDSTETLQKAIDYLNKHK